MELERLLNKKMPRRKFLAGAVFAGLGAAFGISIIQPTKVCANSNVIKLFLPTYHRISSSSILIEDYSRCRQNGWEAISFEDLGMFVTGEGELPEYCFLPTFDDGFVEQKPTILATRDYIKSQWGEEYKAVVFVMTQYEQLSDPVETLPESTLTYKEKDVYKPGEVPRHMTIGDNIELLQKGEEFVRIESHDLNHADLSSPNLSEGALEAEIFESQRRLDILYQRAGMKRIFSALAYPYWQHNAKVRTLTEQAGYTMAFGGMIDRSLQKVMEPVIQTPNERFFLQRMSRT